MTDVMSIPEYYAGKHIFITGGTGFIGKVLIEKLLRSCPEIAGVHCLVRPKRGKAIQERLVAILDEPVFDILKEQQPDFKKKLHAVAGDVVEPELGISSGDRDFLQNNINIVIHSAATINFNEKMRLALELNLVGVQKMVTLAKSMTKLEVFLHVSTAYANCDRSEIDEVVYPPAVRPEKILDMLSWASDDILDTLTPYMIAKKPNTYTYTKQLAETLLIEEGQGLPIVILRPSIVTAAVREPVPGWIDNINGPSGLYIAFGKGLLRTMYGNNRAKADIIPVDYVVNSMVACIWSTAMSRPDKVKIYQVTSGDLNPITWITMEKVLGSYFYQVPMESVIGTPVMCITNNRLVHFVRTWMCHWLPAYTLDLIATVMGKKAFTVRLYDKLHRGMAVLTFFTCREWSWNNSSLLELQGSLLPEDQQSFRVDPRDIHWESYVKNYWVGCKKYVLKEKMSDLPKAKKHVTKVWWAERLIRLGFYLIAMKIASKSQALGYCWFMMVSALIQLLQKTGILRLLYKIRLM